MVQGLAFLSKKSWHTKNLNNQEKVWVAEQRQQAELQKTKELQRQIQQEREQDELHRITGKAAGKIDRGIDWMYQGHDKNSEIAKHDAEKRAEEYLLGKEFVPDGRVKGDLDSSATAKDGVNAVVAAAATSVVTTASYSNEDVHRSGESASFAVQGVREPTVHERNEAFTVRLEDPMYVISQKVAEQKEKIEKNKELFRKVNETVEERSGPKREQKRSRGSDDDDDERRRRDRKRDRKIRKRSHRRDDSSSDDKDRRHRHDHRRGRGRRSNSPVRDRYKSSAGDSHRDRSRDDEHRNRPPSDDWRTNQEHGHDAERPRRYGLQGGVTSASCSAGYYGPDQALLQKKREEQEADRRRKRESSSTRRYQTPEQREAALKAMEQNASSRRDDPWSRPKTTEANDEVVTQGRATFLNDMRQQAHGIHGDQAVSLSVRLRQGRSTSQKPSDSTFL